MWRFLTWVCLVVMVFGICMSIPKPSYIWLALASIIAAVACDCADYVTRRSR